jgi:hypothetical protein
MINPSASGWIDKFFINQKDIVKYTPETTDSFYQKVRNTGFIYGHIIAIETQKTIEINGLLKSEISKVALLNTLFKIYIFTKKELDSERFIQDLLVFYNQMNPQVFNLFQKLLPKDAPSLALEKIIDQRIQTNEGAISKNFSHLMTNALLFIDVLAFQHYLTHDIIPDKYLKNIENAVVNIVALALKTKSNKSPHDDLLIKLFEGSTRYSKFSKVSVQSLEMLELDYFTNDLEKFFLIDIAGISLWSDGIVENNEAYFIHSLAQILSVNNEFVNHSIQSTNDFITQYKTKIPYFNYSNPVKHFYDQTTQSVIKLTTRNKNRLIREIVQSKELMLLLAYSTRRDLDEKEKKKVKKQLLDIFKTIPSLAIFMLPGGSLLLPIFIKFIPNLLPSAFNENLDENE